MRPSLAKLHVPGSGSGALHFRYTLAEGPVAQRLEQGTHNLKPGTWANLCRIGCSCIFRRLRDLPASQNKLNYTGTRYSIRYSGKSPGLRRDNPFPPFPSHPPSREPHTAALRVSRRTFVLAGHKLDQIRGNGNAPEKRLSLVGLRGRVTPLG